MASQEQLLHIVSSRPQRSSLVAKRLFRFASHRLFVGGCVQREGFVGETPQSIIVTRLASVHVWALNHCGEFGMVGVIGLACGICMCMHSLLL
jgi:hypothetical protein